jgi:hypothetical protein
MTTRSPRASRKSVRPRRTTEADWAKHDSECLAVLAYEFQTIDPPEEAERKIKRRLREKRLEAYNPLRFQEIRRFKNELQDELHKADKSDYYTGRHGPFANLADFDHARLVRDFALRHPTVSKRSIAGFMGFAIYIYYLR